MISQEDSRLAVQNPVGFFSLLVAGVVVWFEGRGGFVVLLGLEFFWFWMDFGWEVFL